MIEILQRELETFQAPLHQKNNQRISKKYALNISSKQFFLADPFNKNIYSFNLLM